MKAACRTLLVDLLWSMVFHLRDTEHITMQVYTIIKDFKSTTRPTNGFTVNIQLLKK